MPPFITSTLCATISLCMGQPSADTSAVETLTPDSKGTVSASPSPYAFSLASASPILGYRTDILLAPIDRYLDRQTGAPWWNAAYFGLTDGQLAAQEQSWESPFLSAYHQYMSDGGENGIAVTFRMQTGEPACLLETDVITTLGELVASPTIDTNQIDTAITAWHEYGHCVYHATHPDKPASHAMTDATRYALELYADAFAMSQLWRLHRYDITDRLMRQRDRGLTYANDHTHWTSPALPAWQAYLAEADGTASTDADIEATLQHWVATNDWIAIRDANR